MYYLLFIISLYRTNKRKPHFCKKKARRVFFFEYANICRYFCLVWLIYRIFFFFFFLYGCYTVYFYLVNTRCWGQAYVAEYPSPTHPLYCLPTYKPWKLGGNFGAGKMDNIITLLHPDWTYTQSIPYKAKTATKLLTWLVSESFFFFLTQQLFSYSWSLFSWIKRECVLGLRGRNWGGGGGGGRGMSGLREIRIVIIIRFLFHRPRWLSWMRVRLETWRSRVPPPPRSATFFRGDWSWNIFYGHSLPSADSRRAVVSFWRKNVHNTG